MSPVVTDEDDIKLTSPAKAVKAYRKACERGTGGAVPWAYRLLWLHFHVPEAYPDLHKEYELWTGYQIPHAPPQIVVLGAQRLLPWTVALCRQPPWPPEMPSHAIPVSIVELAYLALAPKASRPALVDTIVQAWQRKHLSPAVNEALTWFRNEEWEVVEIKNGTESVWKHPETSKPSTSPRSRGIPISRKRVPKVPVPDLGVADPDG